MHLSGACLGPGGGGGLLKWSPDPSSHFRAPHLTPTPPTGYVYDTLINFKTYQFPDIVYMLLKHICRYTNAGINSWVIFSEITRS